MIHINVHTEGFYVEEEPLRILSLNLSSRLFFVIIRNWFRITKERFFAQKQWALLCSDCRVPMLQNLSFSLHTIAFHGIVRPKLGLEVLLHLYGPVYVFTRP